MSEATQQVPAASKRPVERKVTAAGAGAALGVALGDVLVWVLDEYVWRDGAVPAPVATLAVVVAAGAVAWCSGWVARHTHRPDLPAAGAEPEP